ncbi:MAG: S8 family serine peptidase [Halobacteriales archaeon]|nr:S8 family serine peptidase [Halobacteriales archaeon]
MRGYGKPSPDSEVLGCLVLLLVLSAVLSVGVPVAQAENTTTHDAEDGLPTTIEDIDELPEVEGATTTTAAVNTAETVVVEARDELTPERLDELRSKGASVESTHDRLVKVEIDGEVTKYTELPWVENVRPPLRPVPKTLGDGAESIGAEEAHEMGVTGDGASVAVIDIGFNPDNERIADNVVEQKTFGTGSIGANQPRHGTASAEMVVDVAPDAELYLASVSTSIGYMNAVDWATQNDVDVITASIGFQGLPNDGTSDVSRESDDAVEDGAVFTASSGNSARLHWQGSFSDTRGNDLLEFGSGDYEVNFFTDRNGNPTEIPAGSVLDVVTTWDDWESVNSNYNLHLVRVGSPGGQPQIVRSADSDATGFRPVKRITAQAPQNGFYGVVVEQTKGTDETVEIFASSTCPTQGYSTTHPRVAS